MIEADLKSVANLNATNVKQWEIAGVVLDATARIPSGTPAGEVIRFAKVLTSAVVHGTSAAWVTSAGAGNLKLGFQSFKGAAAGPAAGSTGGTTKDDALNPGIPLSANAKRLDVIADHTNAGKRVWELMGLEKDPYDWAFVIGTTTAAATAAGSVTLVLSLHYG